MVNDIVPQAELAVLYLSECQQMILRFEKLLMEADMEGRGDFAELFRILHTIKGSSSMMEYAPLVDASHSLESIFAAAKAAPSVLEGDGLKSLVDVGLSFVTYFRGQLLAIQSDGQPKKDENLTAEIEALGDRLGVKSEAAVGVSPPAYAPAETKTGEKSVTVKLKACPMPHIRAFLVAKSAAKLCSSLTTSPENLEKSGEYAKLIQDEGFEIHFVPLNGKKIDEIIKKLTAQPYVLSCTQKLAKQAASEPDEAVELFKNVTVSQSVVNSIISYIDEIAATENALEAYAEEKNLQSRRLNDLLTTLRRTIADTGALAAGMGTHDVGSVFIQMRRTVRTMEKELKKSIKVLTSGDDIQVDKSTLELLSDSLIHIVRNAADHGIEPPQQRAAAGKAKTGVITLAAVKKNDYLTVTVSDDGGGIDRERVLDKAEGQGMLKKARELYTDSEVCRLLLTAGISTNQDVTRFSGRGVGLDTVVRRVRQAGGSVTMESRPGQGTVIILKAPVSLLSIDGIKVETEGGMLIVPANAVSHIHDCGGERPESLMYGGEAYSEVFFPGQISSHGRYLLLLDPDHGRHFIRAKAINMTSTYYVKKMPEYVSDAMGGGYIYFGCAVGADSGLLCILDAARLVRASTAGEASERQS